MRGILERFLPEFTLSLAEGVEMTMRFPFAAFARDYSEFGCGSAALGSSKFFVVKFFFLRALRIALPIGKGFG
jgi:hypothetical protein